MGHDAHVLRRREESELASALGGGAVSRVGAGWRLRAAAALFGGVVAQHLARVNDLPATASHGHRISRGDDLRVQCGRARAHAGLYTLHDTDRSSVLVPRGRASWRGETP